MKKIHLPLLIICLLLISFHFEVKSQVAGYCYGTYTLTDNGYQSGDYYDISFYVVADLSLYSSTVYYERIYGEVTNRPFSVYIRDIPYPSPINPDTYQIYILTLKNLSTPTSDWKYATASYSPFALTANQNLSVEY